MRRSTMALGRLKPGERNKTEAAYEQILELQRQAGEIVWYAFEAITLRLAPDCRLTVDFAVMRADGGLELHDVKGSMHVYTDDAKVKMKVAAEKFPIVIKVAIPVPKKNGGGWSITEVGA